MRSCKKILVTGGSGFIGSAFIRFLLQQKTVGKIVNLDLLTYAANEKNVTTNDPRYVFMKGDICRASLVQTLCETHQIDTIVHFAAESHVDRSIEDPSIFLETNVKGTFTLLEVVRRLPHIHFHHISTDEVYGSLQEGYFTERSAYRPNSPYAASKAASDHFVRAWAHTYGLSTTLSHCTNNFGPYQYPEKFIPRMTLCCLQKEPLPIYGQGVNVRDWLYVDDHAEALWSILQYGKNGEVYDIGGNSEKRNIDLVHEIIDAVAQITQENKTSLQSLITFVPDRPGHDLRYAIDCAKIKDELGWSPRHIFSEALKQTIKWYYEYSLRHSCPA